jgi:hypothetical protein
MSAILLKKIVSGGQAGVDRAALDAALDRGLSAGGWCPKGRLAEDGPIPDRYPLAETPSADYAQRTEWNVRDADATLILSPLPLEGGSLLTEKVSTRLGRPCLAVDPLADGALEAAAGWLGAAQPRALNVAGPRASRWPGGYGSASEFLRRLLETLGAVGLCAGCRHARRLPTKGGSTIYRCSLSDRDPAFPKYPRLPVASCSGFAK